jgi:hypothetical protein
MSRFQPAESYQAKGAAWEFLPFRFERLNGRVLVTNFVGEHLFLEQGEFDQLAAGSLPSDSPLVRKLRAKHVIREVDDNLPVELLAIKARTRYRRLSEFTALRALVSLLPGFPAELGQGRLRHELGDGLSGTRLGISFSLPEHQDRVPGRRAATQLRPDRRSSSRRSSS